MDDLNNKVTGSSLTATEWNQVASEIQAVIESIPLTLTPLDLQQLAKSIATYVANGNFYTDSGSANAYVLTSIGSKLSPVEYGDGMEIRYLAGNSNTGASTINVAALGVKNLKDMDGGDLADGRIIAGTYVRAIYDVNLDHFTVIPEMTQDTWAELKQTQANMLINGGFDIWQRGTSFTQFSSAAMQVADMWITDFGTTDFGTTTRQTFTTGQTEVDGNPTYFARLETATPDAGRPTLKVHVENVRRTNSLVTKLTFWARETIQPSITLELQTVQDFGSGGSTKVSVSTETVTVTNQFQKFEVDIIFPSILGKTISANEDSGFAIGFLLPASTSVQFDLAQVQLESGDVATPFEDRPINETLQLCQRYYETSYNNGVTPGSINDNGAVAKQALQAANDDVEGIQFSVVKRVTPTIAIYAPVNGAINNVNINSVAQPVSSISSPGNNGFRLIAMVSSFGPNANQTYHWTADAAIGPL